MFAVLIVIHLMACVAMIVLILLQRSEGGGLGLGSGGGVGSLMSGRGAANAMTRTTAIFAAVFIATSIALALFAKSTGTTNPLGLPAGSPTSPLGDGSGPLLPGATPQPGGTATPSSSQPPATPTPTQPSAIPQPAAPAPAAPAPSAPTQPAPQPSTPSSGGNP